MVSNTPVALASGASALLFGSASGGAIDATSTLPLPPPPTVAAAAAMTTDGGPAAAAAAGQGGPQSPIAYETQGVILVPAGGQGEYLINWKPLLPGGAAVVVNGQTVSLESGGGGVVVGGKTASVDVTGGVSGLGGALATAGLVPSSGGGGGGGGGQTFEGGAAAAVERMMFGRGGVLGLVGFVVGVVVLIG